MKLRTPIFLTVAATGSFFIIRELNSENSEVVSQTLTEERETPLSGPHPEIQDGTGPLPVKSENTWEPSPVDYSGTGTWDWGVGYTEKDKEKNRADAKRVLGTLEDYTFKFFLPCTVGTGFILDYQIPQNKDEYPTKWYIGTNAHVVWRLSFSENPYKQLSPKRHEWAKDLRAKKQQEIENISKAEKLVRDNCDASDKYGYFDMNISSQKTWEAGRRAVDVGGVANKQMHEPKLFYSAFNFLDPDVARSKGIPPNNHFADFAVVEIEFTSPDIAKAATNGFADKYNVKNNSKPIKFGRSIEKRYGTKKELWEAKDNYFILAYPVVDGKEAWKHTHNFDDKTTFASHLVGNGWDYNKAGRPDRYRGFVSTRKYSVNGTVHGRKFMWHGEEFKDFGHFYAFEHNPLDGGSSGGLFVDSDGHAVAITVQGGGNMTWAQPLRSEGVEWEDFKTPPYDLILGGFEGQKSSYRDQVEEYIFKQQKGTTWLRESGRLNLK